MKTFPQSILLIGAGKMGSALRNAWVDAGINDDAITVVDPAAGFLSLDDVSLIPECVVLAVKPQAMDGLLPQLKTRFAEKTFYISIAAGKTIAYFEEQLGEVAIIRAMPNTPALIGKGISAICHNAKTSNRQKEIADSLLRAAGETLWLDDETLMDAVTAISGSGPAYVFLFMECLVEAGIAQGLPEEVCRNLAMQTITGSVELARKTGEPLATLRSNVTSKGGTTEAALNVMMKDNILKTIFADAITQAVKRAHDL